MLGRLDASWKHLLYIAAFSLAGTALMLGGIVLLIVAFIPTPDIASFGDRQIDQSTRIYDRTGQVLLYDYNRDAKREVIPLANISPNAINAVIAVEDSSFYQHGGIRVTSIIRAIVVDIMGGSLSQGGSTITQQVVKNTLLTKKKSPIRKLREWALAIKLEESYSKNQILETYLNDIPFGGTLYGIEAASEAYFGVSAKDLTVGQAAYLVAMMPAPSYYSPYGSHKAELDARKNLVLERMNTLGFIDEATHSSSKDEQVIFSTGARNTIFAPHFVFHILQQLEEKYGKSALISGLRVTTTLDADLQARAEGILHQYALENEQKFKASNASLIAIEPSTGQILSMVGSRDYFDKEIDGQFNASLALRQPGSTMKPFAYAQALLKGYTRNTVIFDVPTQFSTACSPSDVTNSEAPCYAPQNYDDQFRGPMTFETALAQSINIPAIQVVYLAGVKNVIEFAKRAGLINLGDADQYGLTLVLGGGEVRLLDLVGAFASFGNDGIHNPPTGILSVDDAQGNALESYRPNPSQVLPENIAHDISAMLSNAYARLPEYPLNSPLSFPGYDVAVKTGTTNDTRDAWVVGYTPSVAIGVWTGNNDNSPMVKSVAGFIAAPMWHDVMAYALSKYPRTYFGEPSPISSSVPPMLQGNWMTPDHAGQIIPHSLLYWTDKNNPLGAPPRNSSDDSQFPYWEHAVSRWYSLHPELFTTGIMLPVPLSP